jgi:hypothetical protein
MNTRTNTRLVPSAVRAGVLATDCHVPIMIVGIVINALGVVLAAQRLRRTPRPTGR